jgi:hypothetical protein
MELVRKYNAEYLHKWISNPASEVKPGTAMPKVRTHRRREK